ncbi:pyridoxamine 5'-phosphate oxidase [Roseibium marinum]|uniref:Pyridoxine/pyridoxamine 5'-phosphate oxidase n=1 Tax=Roseibium marinum TaxID=281252 RepID=A0A2S3V137_9HYPH|nr:pyridoxamine 5'-phosphate oxidase [Roseibium marinum]POF33635.1 pyridoxamine 5'-phosphate oxidase [Roseibium marinum]
MSNVDRDPALAFEEDATIISGQDPLALFDEWLALAHEQEINDANAMAIATADAAGLPNVRMVLLKGYDREGFVFYTNTESQKGRELSENAQAAAVLHWKSLRRQVRFRGKVVPVSEDEADAYFNSRARASRIGAWASQQSRPLQNRLALKKAVLAETARFAVGAIPRPPYWHGYRLVPSYMEFWMDKPFRLHDRQVFQRNGPDDPWTMEKFFP